MRAAAAYNKPSNKLEPSPISSPDSFILTVPHPLALTLTEAKNRQARGARAHGAWTKAQAPNRNQPAAAGRPGTHHPPKMAPNRPSFLIHNPELEIELSYTKQMLVLISNRQFFAVLKLPNTSLRVSPRCAKRLRRARPASRKSPRTTAKCERLIGNDMHSPANATALQCAPSIFLIGNEFRFAACAFLPSFFHPLVLLLGRLQAPFSASGSEAYVSQPSVLLLRPLSGHGFSRAESQDRCDSSYRALHPREWFRPAWIWTRFLGSTFAFRVSIFEFRLSVFAGE